MRHELQEYVKKFRDNTLEEGLLWSYNSQGRRDSEVFAVACDTIIELLEEPVTTADELRTKIRLARYNEIKEHFESLSDRDLGSLSNAFNIVESRLDHTLYETWVG